MSYYGEIPSALGAKYPRHDSAPGLQKGLLEIFLFLLEKVIHINKIVLKHKKLLKWLIEEAIAKFLSITNESLIVTAIICFFLITGTHYVQFGRD